MTPPSEHKNPPRRRYSIAALVVLVATVRATCLTIGLGLPLHTSHDEHFAAAMLLLVTFQRAAALLAGGGMLSVAIAGGGILSKRERGLFPAAVFGSSGVVAAVGLAAVVRLMS